MPNQLRLAAYWFSLNVQTAALLAIVVPQVLDRLVGAGHTEALARLATVAAVVAMAAGPAAGALSDAVAARGGARRPILLAGAALNLVGLAAMAGAGGLRSLTASLLVATLGQGISQAAYQALLPDVVPESGWGTASGYMGVATLLGTAAGLGVAGLAGPGAAYAFMVAVLVPGVLAAATVEPARAVPRRAAGGPAGEGALRGRRDYGLAFAARLLLLLGVGLLNTFVLYFLQDDLHLSNPGAGAAGIAGLALAGAAVASLGAGRLSDRAGRSGLVALSGVPMALTAVVFAALPRPDLIFACAGVFGVGYGAYVSVDWALALDVLPRGGHVARDLGVWGIAGGLPYVAAPAVGGWVLSRFAAPAAGYQALFLVAGACFAAGSAVVLAVRRRPGSADLGPRVPGPSMPV